MYLHAFATTRLVPPSSKGKFCVVVVLKDNLEFDMVQLLELLGMSSALRFDKSRRLSLRRQDSIFDKTRGVSHGK